MPELLDGIGVCESPNPSPARHLADFSVSFVLNHD
jgi:hypothetical protein